MVRYDVPDNLSVDGKVVVRNQIAKSRWSGGVLHRDRASGGRGEILHGLTDDLEVEENGVKHRFVLSESGKRLPGYESADLLRTRDQVVQVEQPATRHG